jgi:hypothetical protein
MGLSESDLTAAKESGSIELCSKHLYQVAEELEKQAEAFTNRLSPILRERNPEIEEDRAKMVPANIHISPVTGKCPLAVTLVTVFQKLRLVEIQYETILKNLDL